VASASVSAVFARSRARTSPVNLVVEGRIGGRAGRRAAHRIFGQRGGLRAGQAGRRIDPAEQRPEVEIFHLALPGGPVRRQGPGHGQHER
jgi:hypothetical protein